MEKSLFWCLNLHKKVKNNAIFKQNYALKLFIAFKMAYFCYFSFGENLDFPDFLQNKFYNINCWWSDCYGPSYNQVWQIM